MNLVIQRMLTAAVGFSLATSTMFAQTTPGSPRQQDQLGGRQQREQGTPQNIVKGTELMGFAVRNNRGEELGEIADLAINPRDGSLAYVVLSTGGILGAGAQRYAVPLDKFRIQATEKTAILDVTKQTLQNMQGFEQNNWPREPSRQWQQVPQAGTSQPGMTQPQAGVQPDQADRDQQMAQADRETQDNQLAQADQQQNYMVRASNLIGFDVRNSRGESLGEIEDLVVNPQTGSVEYAVLSTGGFLGFGDKFYAVPLDKLNIQPGEKTAILEVNRQQLEQMPAFDTRSWPLRPDGNWDNVPEARQPDTQTGQDYYNPAEEPDTRATEDQGL